jgi:uncharacterized protein DUF4231
MNVDEYLEVRVDDQINWYNRKSLSNKKIYKILRIVEIAIAASIPFISGYINYYKKMIENLYPETPYLDNLIPIFIGFLGLTLAVIASILSLYKFHENWIEYRTTCETLKHEKYLFLTKTEPYNISNPFPLFVKRIENLISKEHSKWAQYIKTSSEEGKPSTPKG